MAVGAETEKPTPPKKDDTGLSKEDILAALEKQMASAGLGNLFSGDNALVWTGQSAKSGKDYTLTVKQYAEVYSAALLDPNDKRHQEAMEMFTAFRNFGVFGETITPQSVYTGFRRIGLSAANTYRNGNGKKITPRDNYSNALQVLAKYQQVDDQTQKTFQGFTDKESSTMAWNAYKQAFGRAPSAEEVQAYRKALMTAAQAAPSITTVKMVNGQRVETQSGGFDLKAWSAGYMSGLLPKETAKVSDLAGNAGVYQDYIRSTADDYGIVLDNANVFNRVRQMLDNELTQDQLAGQFIGLAKARYGAGMAAALDTGLTVKQVVEPFVKTYADLMGVNQDSVRVSDIAPMASIGEGDKQRLLSNDEFTALVRSKPEWQRTDVAKREAYDLGQSVLKMFGLVK